MKEHLLDITHLECPMTFVRAKLFLEGLVEGDLAAIRLNAGETLENLPLAVKDEGHQILSLVAEEPGNKDENSPVVHLLKIKVAGD